jgi:hypothetical protein
MMHGLTRRAARARCVCVMGSAALFGMLAVCPPAARAQAPVTTAAGDPSVRADTIDSLAVDPANRPDASAVLLLNDAVVRIGAASTSSASSAQTRTIARS